MVFGREGHQKSKTVSKIVFGRESHQKPIPNGRVVEGVIKNRLQKGVFWFEK